MQSDDPQTSFGKEFHAAQSRLGDAGEDSDAGTDDVDDLAAALATIREAYGDDYDEWLRFANDATDHARENGLDVEFHDPNVHMPVVRYQKIDADTIRRNDDLTDAHTDALVSFAAALDAGEVEGDGA